MSKTIELLGQQHQDVLACFAEVEGKMGGDGHDLAEFLAFLEREVGGHFTLEEQALFPVMARHPHLAQGPLRVMESEHATFRELRQRLADAVQSKDYAAQREAAAAVMELLREHIAKEDQVLFPMALQTLSADEQREVETRAAQLAAR